MYSNFTAQHETIVIVKVFESFMYTFPQPPEIAKYWKSKKKEVFERFRLTDCSAKARSRFFATYEGPETDRSCCSC